MIFEGERDEILRLYRDGWRVQRIAAWIGAEWSEIHAVLLGARMRTGAPGELPAPAWAEPRDYNREELIRCMTREGYGAKRIAAELGISRAAVVAARRACAA